MRYHEKKDFLRLAKECDIYFHRSRYPSFQGPIPLRPPRKKPHFACSSSARIAAEAQGLCSTWHTVRSSNKSVFSAAARQPIAHGSATLGPHGYGGTQGGVRKQEGNQRNERATREPNTQTPLSGDYVFLSFPRMAVASPP